MPPKSNPSTEEQAAPAADQPKIKYAILALDQSLLGYVAEKPAQGDFVEVPLECDLQPGHYVWNGETFMPNWQHKLAEKLVNQPNTMRAIARGFAAIRDGKPLPVETLIWLNWYEKTIDG